MESNISSNRVLRKLRALEIINNKSVHALDMADVLFKDRVLSHHQMEEIRTTSGSRSELLLKGLELAAKEGRVHLLDYEWQILPTQRVIITVVTDSGIKEFKHEEF
jgi:hypothetical protein